MKAELDSSASANAMVGVPAGALSPPATLSPPSSPSVHPHCPWSPGAGSVLGQHHDRISAFSLVNGYAARDMPALPANRGRRKFLISLSRGSMIWWMNLLRAVFVFFFSMGYIHTRLLIMYANLWFRDYVNEFCIICSKKLPFAGCILYIYSYILVTQYI